MIAIVDYDAGNIRSVAGALERLGQQYELTADPERLLAADRVILPGVGNAAHALESLRQKGLCEVIRSLRRPVLGICVGLQILCRDSEEGPVEGLGVFDAHVRRFPDEPQIKVPHMGWNALGNLDGKLMKGLQSGTFVYFVHSYYPSLCQDTVATCRHGSTLFSAALRYENFYGTQFHPEKSGDAGSRILQNFIDL
ncbi:MAG: imidazole glycerol phosphate synthase subunit HisH [Bacteroidales bacterium]|jgi:glutamine amidotransferase|nr:imidazole glycerol phosphate synthase subunit HisH [Bacteroidales bacterium]MBR1502215.1 imidazole glycerol phosphate synthase subunit HisH [Bacteroidales bacterium]MDY6464709.1 imidazole glycerol phosphate synthase subunit HisH [Bacteroidales bacterium]